MYVINVETYKTEFTNDYALKDNFSGGIKCYVFSHNSDNICNKGTIQCPVNILKYSDNPVVTEHLHTDKNENKKYYEVRGFSIKYKNGNYKTKIS